ncbi:hypothetical protein [Aliivibrio wodanis]|uniref:hypothetical protein n=1 Tax=Aliivibrio wodanis TaxID=80852 RepID=UPI00406C187A
MSNEKHEGFYDSAAQADLALKLKKTKVIASLGEKLLTLVDDGTFTEDECEVLLNLFTRNIEGSVLVNIDKVPSLFK